MKKWVFILFCGFLTWMELPAQSGFFRTYGKVPQDYAYSLEKTFDGGYILGGTSNGYGGTSYLFLIKTDANGDTSWVHAFVTSNSTYATSICQCSDSGYAICGNTGFARVDKNGNMMWNNLYSNIFFYSIRSTSDGGFILAGSIGLSSGSGGKDVFLLKTDAYGIKQWSRKLGGVNDDYATCIRQLPDGGYIFAGTTVSYGAGSYDIYVARLHSTGDTLWTRAYGGTLADAGNTKQTVERTFDNGYIIAGYTNSFFTAGSTDAYVIKIDSSGNEIWSKLYGGSGADYFLDAKQCSDSGYIFVGNTTSFGAGGNDIYVVRTDANGDTLFTRAFGGGLADFSQAVVQTSDKGFTLSGYTTNYGAGNNDVLLLKIDSTGNGPCKQFNTTTIISTANTQENHTTTGKIFLTLNSTQNMPLMKSGAATYDVCTFVDVEEIGQKSSLAIYPTPSSGEIFFNSEITQPCEVTVHDITGQVVFRKKYSSIAAGEKISLAHLAAGSYFLQMNQQVFKLVLSN